MNRTKRWSDMQLTQVVASSYGLRAVMAALGLVPAGGNYQQISKRISELGLDTCHFTGMGWRKNRTFAFAPKEPLEALLKEGVRYQSFKLKRRLFLAGLKLPQCERCGWAERSEDGRIPVELDYIDGDRFDNRLENLRILCPNCHSLQLTHRGKNQRSRGGGIGRHATLKML